MAIPELCVKGAGLGTVFVRICNTDRHDLTAPFPLASLWRIVYYFEDFRRELRL